MKRFTFITLCLLFLSIIIPQISPPKMVTNTNRLISTAVPETDMNCCGDYLDVEVLAEESFQYAIACFAVRDDGMLALGFDSLDTHTVFVYDQEGAFQYGLRFHLPGSIGIFFSGETLWIYSARGGFTAKFDGYSQFIEVRKVTNDLENNNIIRSVMNGTEVKNSVGTYTLERNIGILSRSYSKVVFNNGNNLKVLYEISETHAVMVILNVLCTAGFISLLWFVVTYSTRKNMGREA